MLGLIKKTILNNKQNQIKRRFPRLNMVLHKDMPVSYTHLTLPTIYSV